MARKARTLLIRSMASRVVCIPWELSRVVFHLSRQGVNSRHGSDGCANTSAKNIQFSASHTPPRTVKSWNRGNKEARVEKTDSAAAARFLCRGAAIIGGKLQLHFLPTTVF